MCLAILKRIAEAMSPKSRLLIQDIIVPARTEVGEDLGAYWMDVRNDFRYHQFPTPPTEVPLAKIFKTLTYVVS